MLAAVIAEGVAIVLLGVLVLGPAAQPRPHPQGAARARRRARAREGGRHGGHDRHDRAASPDPCPSSSSPGSSRRPARTPPRAHDIIGTDLDRAEQRVTVTTPGTRTLLAFLTSGCSVCQTFWDEFQGAVDVPGDGALRVIAKGPAEESVASLRALAGDRDVVQSSGAWVDYDIPGSPYFVYVEGGVVTGEGSATTWAQVRDLMAQGVADNDEARAAAGRTGPGCSSARTLGRGERDSLPRMDSELLAAGIRPGHPSLYRARHRRRSPARARTATPHDHPRARPPRPRPRTTTTSTTTTEH